MGRADGQPSLLIGFKTPVSAPLRTSPGPRRTLGTFPAARPPRGRLSSYRPSSGAPLRPGYRDSPGSWRYLLLWWTFHYDSREPLAAQRRRRSLFERSKHVLDRSSLFGAFRRERESVHVPMYLAGGFPDIAQLPPISRSNASCTFSWRRYNTIVT